jgi:hypothetical protein
MRRTCLSDLWWITGTVPGEILFNASHKMLPSCPHHVSPCSRTALALSLTCKASAKSYTRALLERVGLSGASTPTWLSQRAAICQSSIFAMLDFTWGAGV